MTYLTPDEARKTTCPLARCYGGNVQSECRGDDCTLWRWQRLSPLSPRFDAPIEREKLILREGPMAGKPEAMITKKARENVLSNPSGYGVKNDVGYCGLGGEPT